MFLRRFCAGLAAALCVACGTAPEGQAPTRSAAAGGTLVVSTLADIDTVNDLISSGAIQARDVERLLLLQLARENSDFEQGPATYGPRLAERWEWSEDRLALTFHLREATWSDGVPITAEDVRWTWEAQTHPDVAWRARRSKKSIRDVEVIDSRTVRFHFTESYPNQLEDANRGVVLPRHAWGELPFSEWRRSGAWFAERMVSSGPFVLEEWRPGQEIVLRRNERYYKAGAPLLDRLVFLVIPEKPAQISQILGGSIDYVQVIPPDQIERIEAHADTELDAYWGRQFDYLCWNARRPPLDDPAVRRALTQATDRQAIVDSIYRGYARVGVTGILSSTWAFDATLEPWPYDRGAADAALAAAGFADVDGDGVLERDGERLAFELIVQNGNRVHQDAATLIQAQLARAGVELQQRPLEFQTWVDKVKAGEFDVAIGGWEIPSSLDMGFAFHSDEIGNFNFGGYRNADLDAVLEAANRAAETDERRRLLHQVQAILHHDQPYTFLWEPQKLNARRRRVRDSRPNALTSFYNIDEWRIEER